MRARTQLQFPGDFHRRSGEASTWALGAPAGAAAQAPELPAAIETDVAGVFEDEAEIANAIHEGVQ